MTLTYWSKDTLQNLTPDHLAQWHAFLHRCGETLGLDELQHTLHQKTRTPHLYEVYLWQENDTIVCACTLVSKGLALDLEALWVDEAALRLDEQKYFVNRVLKALKEREMWSLSVDLLKDNQPVIDLLMSEGFKPYHETKDHVKLKVTLLDRPRTLVMHSHGRLGFLTLFKGIPYHPDNHERFYKDALRRQKEHWIMVFFFLNAFFFFYARHNPLRWSPLGVNLSLSWGLFGLYSLSNLTRYITLRHQTDEDVIRYLEVLKSYTKFTLVFMLVLSMLVLLGVRVFL